MNLKRREMTRKKLRDIALKHFSAKGYPMSGVQEIAEEAGVTKGAFYYYFHSKEEVLKDLHDEFLDDEIQRASGVVAKSLPADVALKLIIQEILVSVDIHSQSIKVFLRDRTYLSPDTQEEVREKRDTFEEIVTSTIARGIAEGVFRTVESPRIMAFGIIGMCAWAHEWFRASGPLDAKSVASMYGDVIVAGLRPGPDLAPTSRRGAAWGQIAPTAS